MNWVLANTPVSWNPAIGVPEAIALALMFLATAVWLAWRGSRGVPLVARVPLLSLRTTGVTLVAICWLNPGRWLEEVHATRSDWLVLLDRSASMRAEHAEGKGRWEEAIRVAETLRKAANPQHGEVHVDSFSGQLENAVSALEELSPTGAATDLGSATSSALNQRPTSLAGLIILSDGRETARANLAEIALRARARGVPIHTVPFGAAWGSRDLALTAVQKQLTAFREQPVAFAAQLENRGLGPIKPTVVLLGPDGTELGRKDVQLKEGGRQTITFEVLKVPEAGGDFLMKTEPWPGEHVPTNNMEAVGVNVLASKTRVLLLEGAPYWDSKFLAQLLRQQNAVEILTVHRLNEERYFRVEAAGAEPLLSPETVFPSSAEALARYDLIVFGKGADGFLTPARVAALQTFVRDQGGAVLFARGKPYSGSFPALEVLEPVEWGDSLSGGFHFTPLADAGVSLFGAALPAAGDRVWRGLPPLDDVHSVLRLRPFARVLAEGVPEGRETRLPLLVARRYGRGMVATVNADGLWRWDFRPEVREQGGLYQQFWVQLMQWCATYSEFRPGQDYAVRLRDGITEAGQPVRATIAYRGSASAPKPVLRIRRAGEPVREAAATPLPGSEGGREWAAMIAADKPGRYEIRVADEAQPEREEGDATLTIIAPPQEGDDLRPDPESLAILARESGGQVFPPDKVEQLAAQLWAQDPDAPAGKPQWEPLWTNWWMAVLLGIAFGGEWWMRRREGML